MQNKFKLKGVWFLPGSEERFNGYLTYSPTHGIQLELLGVLSEKNNKQYEQEFIVGTTSDGKKITLHKCFSTKRSFSSNGFETSNYDILFLFIGKHFSSMKDFQFSNISCEYKDFDNWLDLYGFTNIKYQKETKETIHEYKQLDDMLFEISDELQCKFKFDTYTTGSIHNAEAKIKQVCEVVLIPKQGSKEFEQLLSWFQTFTAFLTLAYFERPLLNKLSLNIESISENDEKYFKEIELYYQREVLKKDYGKKNHRNYFLFVYKDIKENLEIILQKWFNAQALINPTIAGLTEAFIKREQVIEFKFLNIAHAIELYHRRTKSNEVVSKEIHKKKIEEIIDSVNPEYSLWLKRKLEFSNEPTLSERLEELINEVPAKVKLILFKPSIEEFI